MLCKFKAVAMEDVKMWCKLKAAKGCSGQWGQQPASNELILRIVKIMEWICGVNQHNLNQVRIYFKSYLCTCQILLGLTELNQTVSACVSSMMLLYLPTWFSNTTSWSQKWQGSRQRHLKLMLHKPCQLPRFRPWFLERKSFCPTFNYKKTELSQTVI